MRQRRGEKNASRAGRLELKENAARRKECAQAGEAEKDMLGSDTDGTTGPKEQR